MSSARAAADPLSSNRPVKHNAGELPELHGDDLALVRYDHASEESFVRAVGTVNYVLAGLDALSLLNISQFAVSHAVGLIRAPWIAHPYYAASFVLLCCAFGSAVATGRGLRSLRPWALTAQKTMFVFQGLHFVLSFTYELWRSGFGFALAGVSFFATLLVPIAVLLWAEPEFVLSDEYQRAIGATPHLAVPAKLPTELKLAMAIMFLATGIGMGMAAAAVGNPAGL